MLKWPGSRLENSFSPRLNAINATFYHNIKLPGRQRGTGMVEVIVALALLGVIGTTFLGAVRMGWEATAVIKEQATSRNLAYSQLEVIRASSYGDTYPVSIESPNGYSLSIDTSVVDGNMQKIRVIVHKNNKPLLCLEDLKAIQ